MTAPEAFSAVRDALEAAKIRDGQRRGRSRRPENTVRVSGHTAEQVLKLMEELEDHEDVQSVSPPTSTSDDEEMAQFSAA